jgi:predicted glycoside hydrolase/deacetylase ChbG (UPF0249 family)
LKPLIVCADDFAITPQVSDGIALLAEQGRITATSVMSLSPHWPSNANLLAAVRDKVDIGLHVDFTSDFAMDAGQGDSLGFLMLKSSLHVLDPSQIEHCLHHQLDLFEMHHGAPPHHVDGHQHVHQFPVIRKMLIQVLMERYKGAQMPWLRISKVPSAKMNLKAAVINAMGANALKQLAQEHHMPHSNFLTGIYDFSGDANAYTGLLSTCLENVPEGSVLMCHPGLPGGNDSPYAAARIWEQQVLQGQTFEELLDRLQLTLVRGSQTLQASS